MLKAFPLPVMSSHYQKTFPLLVKRGSPAEVVDPYLGNNKWYQSLLRSFDQKKNNTQVQQNLHKWPSQAQGYDKNKEGLGYSVVPPPTQVYSPPKKDMSWTGLPEFADDTITDYSRPTPSIDTSNSVTSDPQRNYSSVFELGESSGNIMSKPVIKFIKAADSPTVIKTNKVETVRKPSVKYAEIGCSRHMTGNISYLSDYEPYDGGHNLVRGLPSKFFENNHTYAACMKGKRHKASCKTKLVHSVTKPFHTLHMDLFGPTSVSSLNHKWCDNGGEFRNKEMNDFCLRKGIKREFNNARTLQQNGVAERINRTLIEVARTILADAKLPVTFWAEVVNIACYVQNRVLVNKSQNKTPYELFNGRTPTIGFLKLFGCDVMILNTLDNLGKFDAKGDEGYFIRYSMSSKVFMVFNKRTKRVEENLHVDFLENKLIEKGAGPNWLFDIGTLTNSMNYVPVVVAGTTSTNFSAHLESSTSKAQDSCNADAPESNENSNPTATSTNPLADHMETLIVEYLIPTVSSPVLTACLDDSSQPSSDTRLISKRVTSQDDTPSLNNILTLSNRFEDIIGVTSNTGDSHGVEADLGNMKNNISASPTPTFRIHKDHPKSQIIGPVDTPVQTKTKSKEMEEQSFIASTHHMTNLDLLSFCLFSCFLSQEEPKKISDALKDPIYQMDVKSTFLYGIIDEEVYGKDRTGKDVDLHLYRSMIGSLMYLTASRPDIMFAVCACARHQVTPKECHLHAIKRISRYLKGHPKLGIWYPKYSPFDLVAYSDSDYDGATQDRKSTTGGCQFLGRRLISWQCKSRQLLPL
nr:hypothetical protein [Tanacetum cinerariifolium]